MYSNNMFGWWHWPKEINSLFLPAFLSTFQAFFYSVNVSLVFLLLNSLHALHFSTNFLTFLSTLWKNKLFFNLLVNPLWSRCAPLCVSSMAFLCCFSGRTIHSLLKNQPITTGTKFTEYMVELTSFNSYYWYVSISYGCCYLLKDIF